MSHCYRLSGELEKDLSLNTTISFVVSKICLCTKNKLRWMFQVCLLLVMGVMVTSCHLGGAPRDKRRLEARHQRAEMIMIKGYWRSKPGA